MRKPEKVQTKWGTFKDIKRTQEERAKRVAKLLTKGHSTAWKEHGGMLEAIFIAYYMHFWLPRWLIQPKTWDESKTKLRHGAFIVYKVQVDDDLLVAYNLATLGSYSSANIILRACLEYLCRGAFFDCIAKESYRKTTGLIEKESKQDEIGEKGSIQRILDDINTYDLGFLNELEDHSAAILDKLSVFMPSKAFRGMFPTFKEIVEQLDEWNLFHPIDRAASYIYDGGYHALSLPAHGSIDHIDSGRRLVDEKPLFALPEFDPQQFAEFLSNFCQILDIGLVLTLNIMRKEAPGAESTISLIESHPFLEQLPITSFRQLLNELSKEYLR